MQCINFSNSHQFYVTYGYRKQTNLKLIYLFMLLFFGINLCKLNRSKEYMKS